MAKKQSAVKFQYIPFSSLVFLENNPRTRTEEGLSKMAADIQRDPAFYENRPTLVNLVNGEYRVYAGDLRAHAAHDVLGWAEVPCNVETGVDAELMRRRAILDNTHREGWDADKLAQWDYEPEELEDMGVEWGVDIDDESEGGVPNNALNSEAQGEQDQKEAIAARNLAKSFIVPPFSILDTRQGYWLERKDYWKTLIKDNGESRDGVLFKSNNSDPVSIALASLSNGVSILDPVLAECLIYWFGVDDGKSFDCFAGDTVFGFVSAMKGMDFTGIELRGEQASLNNERVSGMSALYICDDGQNIGNHIAPNSQDFFFSCPPYFDLEVYSDLAADASNQAEYADFLQIIDTAFSESIKCLRENRFAAIVVGDVRDKHGFYRGLPDDVKRIFKKNGMQLYNDLVLIESIGTGRLRAAPNMKVRKVVKCHQNVLVFYKGDPKKIKEFFPFTKFESEYEGADVEL